MALKTLQQLAGNTSTPVCYPFSSQEQQKRYNETEGFKWFVCNDQAAASKSKNYKGQFLRGLNTKNSQGELEIIPLDANIHCPAKK